MLLCCCPGVLRKGYISADMRTLRGGYDATRLLCHAQSARHVQKCCVLYAKRVLDICYMTTNAKSGCAVNGTERRGEGSRRSRRRSRRSRRRRRWQALSPYALTR
eukprot:2792542-Rhodomonas_salina.4